MSKRQTAPVSQIPTFRRTVPGSAPGMLAVDPEAPGPRITIIGYGPDEHAVLEDAALENIARCRGRWPVLWVNVDGLGDEATLTHLAEAFALHGPHGPLSDP